MKRCRALGLIALLVIWVGLPMGVLADEASTVIGDDYVLASGEVMNQDLVIVGGTATLMQGSLVIGDVAVMGGELLVDGEVQGDIVAFGGSLYLNQHAQISGDVISFGRLERHAEARITGNLVESAEVGGGLARFAEMLRNRPELQGLGRGANLCAASTADDVLGGIIKLVVLVGLAIALASVFPKRMEHVAAVMTSSALLSLGVGLMALIVAPLLMFILIIICIGIPVALVLALALFVLGLAGWIAAGAVVGQQMVKWTKLDITSPPVIAAGGTALITLISFVPCLGGLLSLALVAWALGAIVLSRLGSTVDTTWAPLTQHHPAQDAAKTESAETGAPAKPRDTHKLD